MVQDLMEQGLTDADGKLPTDAAGRRRIAERVVSKIQEAVEAFTIGMADLPEPAKKELSEAYDEWHSNMAKIAENPAFCPGVDGKALKDQLLQYVEQVNDNTWQFWVCRHKDCASIIRASDWIRSIYVKETPEYQAWVATGSQDPAGKPKRFGREPVNDTGNPEDSRTGHFYCPRCARPYKPTKMSCDMLPGQHVLVTCKDKNGARKPISCMEDLEGSNCQMFLSEWEPSDMTRLKNRMKEVCNDIADKAMSWSNEELLQNLCNITDTGCPIVWRKEKLSEFVKRECEQFAHEYYVDYRKGIVRAYWEIDEFRWFQYQHKTGDPVMTEEQWLSMLAMGWASVFAAKMQKTGKSKI